MLVWKALPSPATRWGRSSLVHAADRELAKPAIARSVRWATPGRKPGVRCDQPQWVAGVGRAGRPGGVFEGVVEELLGILGDRERERSLDVFIPAVDAGLAFSLRPNNPIGPFGALSSAKHPRTPLSGQPFSHAFSTRCLNAFSLT